MNNILNNKFLTFEGIDGCGKSLQSKLLHDYLVNKGEEVVLTREIGGTEVSEKIRNLIMSTDPLPVTELWLIMAARYEHMQRVIIPALRAGKWVICDRFIDSTICYQGDSAKMSISRILELNNNFVSTVMPSVTFFIDISPELAQERIAQKNETNKYDHNDLDFHHRMRANFFKLYRLFPYRLFKIDAQFLSSSEVHSLVKRKLFNSYTL